MPLLSHFSDIISGISQKMRVFQHPKTPQSMPPGLDVVKNGGGNVPNGNALRSRRTTNLPAPNSSQPVQPSLKRRRSEPQPLAPKRRDIMDIVPKVEGEVEFGGRVGRVRTSETSDVSDRSDAKKSQKPSKNGRRVYPGAEIYSKKLYTQMANGYDLDENSDTEAEGVSKQAILTDPWKQEYSFGTQELANADNLPQTRTVLDDFWLEDKSEFQFPTKMIACDVNAPYVNNSVFMSPPISPQTYQITAQDEIFIGKLNADRPMLNNRVYMTEKIFSTIITHLEESTFFNAHHQILNDLHAVYVRPPEHGSPEEELVPCDICGDADYGADDEMVFCDMCNTCVHCSCGGVTELPPGNKGWKCLKCSIYGNPAPRCELCPVLGGSMVCDEEKRRWTHHVCALFHPEVEFGDVDTRQPVRDLEKIHLERFAGRCSVCDTTQGATISCVEPGCEEQFHVCCALRAGLVVRIVEKAGVPDNIFREVRCHRHTTDPQQVEKLPEIYKGKWSAQQNPRLAEKEHSFFLLTNYENAAKVCGKAELVVSDIYEYWKQRRRENNCRPLIPKLHQHVKIVPEITEAAQRAVDKLQALLPDDSHAGQFFPRAALMVTEMRQHHLKRVDRSMKDGVRMLSLLHRREQFKRKKVQAEQQLIHIAMNSMKKLAQQTNPKEDALSLIDGLLEKAWKIPKDIIKKTVQTTDDYLKKLQIADEPKKQPFSWNPDPSPLRPRNSCSSSVAAAKRGSNNASIGRAVQKPKTEMHDRSEEDMPPAKRRSPSDARELQFQTMLNELHSSLSPTPSVDSETSSSAPPTCSRRVPTKSEWISSSSSSSSRRQFEGSLEESVMWRRRSMAAESSVASGILMTSTSSEVASDEEEEEKYY